MVGFGEDEVSASGGGAFEGGLEHGHGFFDLVHGEEDLALGVEEGGGIGVVFEDGVDDGEGGGGGAGGALEGEDAGVVVGDDGVSGEEFPGFFELVEGQLGAFLVEAEDGGDQLVVGDEAGGFEALGNALAEAGLGVPSF